VEAQRLIERSIMDPERLAVVQSAFDRAWKQAQDLDGAGIAIGSRRLDLARVVLSLCSQFGDDADLLACEALSRFRGFSGQ
jgi:hypothetical protein